MIIKILPHQVPRFWEAVKSAYQQTGAMTDTTYSPLANEMLHNLLSHKSQCWVVLDQNRVLTGIVVTSLKYDKFSGCKYLFGELIYAWEKMPREIWSETWDIVRAYGRAENCRYVAAHAISGRAKQFALQLGMTELGTNYKIDL